MGAFFGVVAVALAVIGLLLHLFAHMPVSELLGFGAGALCLLWMALLLTLPWNLYFQARTVRQQIAEGRAVGVGGPEGREAEAERIARRLLRGAIAAHVLSAAVTAVVTAVSGRELGYWFSAFYLLSTVFRPAEAWLRHLRARLGVMQAEAHFPRDDVRALRTRVEAAESSAKQLVEDNRRLAKELDLLGTTLRRREDQLEQRILSMGRRFEDAVGSLTDNQEVITGIRAFLRLLRETPTG